MMENQAVRRRWSHRAVPSSPRSQISLFKYRISNLDPRIPDVIPSLLVGRNNILRMGIVYHPQNGSSTTCLGSLHIETRLILQLDHG